jgi:hypothetical protein
MRACDYGTLFYLTNRDTFNAGRDKAKPFPARSAATASDYYRFW